MDNPKAIIESAESEWITSVKTTCFISNMDNFHNLIFCTVNISHQINTQRSCVEVARLPGRADRNWSQLSNNEGITMNEWMKLCFLILAVGQFSSCPVWRTYFLCSYAGWLGLTNTQIGFGFTVYAAVQTIGLFSSYIYSRSFSKKYFFPQGLIGVGLCGLISQHYPLLWLPHSFWCYGFFFGEVVYWPVLFKAVRLLGKQGWTGTYVRLSGSWTRSCGCINCVRRFIRLCAVWWRKAVLRRLVCLLHINHYCWNYHLLYCGCRRQDIPQDDEDVNKQIFKG